MRLAVTCLVRIPGVGPYPTRRRRQSRGPTPDWRRAAWRLRLDTLDHEKIGTSVAACYGDWRLRLDTLARCGSTLAACPWAAPRGSSPRAESAWVVLVANVNVRKL